MEYSQYLVKIFSIRREVLNVFSSDKVKSHYSLLVLRIQIFPFSDRILWGNVPYSTAVRALTKCHYPLQSFILGKWTNDYRSSNRPTERKQEIGNHKTNPIHLNAGTRSNSPFSSVENYRFFHYVPPVHTIHYVMRSIYDAIWCLPLPRITAESRTVDIVVLRLKPTFYAWRNFNCAIVTESIAGRYPALVVQVFLVRPDKAFYHVNYSISYQLRSRRLSIPEPAMTCMWLWGTLTIKFKI